MSPSVFRRTPWRLRARPGSRKGLGPGAILRRRKRRADRLHRQLFYSPQRNRRVLGDLFRQRRLPSAIVPASGTTRLTKPKRSASCAEIGSPVKSISMAMPRGIRYCSITVANLAPRPRFASGSRSGRSPRRCEFASQSQLAAAGQCVAVHRCDQRLIGFDGDVARMRRLIQRAVVRTDAIGLLLKNFVVLLEIGSRRERLVTGAGYDATLIEGSWRIFKKASTSPLRTSWPSAFIRSGRLIVTIATCATLFEQNEIRHDWIPLIDFRSPARELPPGKNEVQTIDRAQAQAIFRRPRVRPS